MHPLLPNSGRAAHPAPAALPRPSCGAVKLMGTRDKAADIDFSDFLEEEAESQLKEAGEHTRC